MLLERLIGKPPVLISYFRDRPPFAASENAKNFHLNPQKGFLLGVRGEAKEVSRKKIQYFAKVFKGLDDKGL